jgi:acyl dehydratase
MIDRAFIGHVRQIGSISLEPSMIRLFAQAIGERNPVFLDEEAAKAAGYPAIPMPPTFLFCLRSMADKDATDLFRRMGVRLDRLLHGEQEIEQKRPIYAGERLTFESRILDIYDKSEGKLTFIVELVTANDTTGQEVGALTSSFVVRN